MDVILHPNPALTQVSQPVDPTAEKDLGDLCKRMARLMLEAPGIGLAAPQIGVLKRVIVIAADVDDEKRGVVALCNPEIVDASEEVAVDEEGCLSLPGISVPIERPTKVTCSALSLGGKQLEIEAEGLQARLLQHEIDHLDGVLMIDRATPEERKAALVRYREALATGAKPGQTSL